MQDISSFPPVVCVLKLVSLKDYRSCDNSDTARLPLRHESLAGRELRESGAATVFGSTSALHFRPIFRD
jgi:hypothetical protein